MVGRDDPSSSTKNPLSPRHAESEPLSEERPNRNGTIQSTSQVLRTEMAAARGSARTLLRLKPANSHGLPLDAAMMEEDLNPMVAIQFCQCLLRRG
jgi:hypothetical protein